MPCVNQCLDSWNSIVDMTSTCNGSNKQRFTRWWQDIKLFFLFNIYLSACGAIPRDGFYRIILWQKASQLFLVAVWVWLDHKLCTAPPWKQSFITWLFWHWIGNVATSWSPCFGMCWTVFPLFDYKKTCELECYIYIEIYHIPIKEEFQTFQIPNIAYAVHMYCFVPVVPQQLVSLRVCHGFAKHRAGECADTRANWILVSGLKSSLFGTENTVLAVVFLDVQDQGRNVQNKSQHKGVKNVRCFWHFESWVTNETLD